MKRRRALTLVEVLVAMALAGLLLAMLVNFFFAALAASQRSVVRSRLQQTGLTALLQLIRDLQRANAGGITLLYDGNRQLTDCVIHPVADINADGLPVYSNEELMCYHFNATRQTLVRRAFSTAFPCPVALKQGEPMRFTADDLPALKQARAFERYYREVEKLNIFTPGVDPEYVGSPLHVHFLMQQQATGSTAPEQVECDRTVLLRNSL